MKKAKLLIDSLHAASGTKLRMGQTVWIVGEDPADKTKWQISLGPVRKLTDPFISIPKTIVAVAVI